MKTPFSYQVITYSHDPATGERLNVGVLLYAAERRYLGLRIDQRFERLSKAFAGFDGDHYRQVMRRLERSADEAREKWIGSIVTVTPPDLKSISTQVLGDEGLSLRLGIVLGGITEDPDTTLEQLFDRMVLSQYVRQERPTRSDEEVWFSFKKPLAERQVTQLLQPKTITTPDLELGFDHAYKNQNWHLLQPLSFDLSRADAIQRKAAQWLGNGTALKAEPEVGSLMLLLGQPQLKSQQQAYIRAKNLLHKIPLKHELIEENEAEKFAVHLTSFIREHPPSDY